MHKLLEGIAKQAHKNGLDILESCPAVATLLVERDQFETVEDRIAELYQQQSDYLSKFDIE